VNDTQVEVREVLVTTLGLDGRADDIVASTPLLDSMPELDSMAVVELLVSLEERFGITIADDELSGDVFATLGTLSEFVERKRVGSAPHL
jgi:acyl carrier protein